MNMPINPKIPLGASIETSIDFLAEHLSFATKAFAKVVESGIELLVGTMMFLPPWLVILLAAGLCWRLSKSRAVAMFTMLGLGLIWNLGFWSPTISTIALVLVATSLAIIIGMPLGILTALSQPAYRLIMPVLDFMQTMPAFVYLIPAIPFFGLGKVAAIFSTVIFAMPPAIRLTCLGIRQVPRELVEASDAFGATRGQKLLKLQLPMAASTIMAGVNQTVMLALSMVVVAAMIGAKGLGGEVWKAIQRLDPARGFEAGLGIVIVAMIFDRVMQRIVVRKRS
jgi:glycine betaine/proline transport system permease protein